MTNQPHDLTPASPSFARQLASGIVILLVLTLVTGGIFPLLTAGIAQVLLPGQANGSLLYARDGTVIGSELIGQQFTAPRYFHPRPSAAGDKGYDALSSGGSNLGPTNKKLADAVQANAAAYRQENGLAPDVPVPVDAVTASGSGLDPEISPANALLQVPRVAKARNLPVDQVRTLVEQHVAGRTLGILGEPRVNVLELNLALDQAKSSSG